MQKSSVLKSSPRSAVPEGPQGPEGPEGLEAAAGRAGGSRVGRHRRLATAAACVAVLGLFGTACSDSSDGSDDKGSKDSTSQNSGRTDEDQTVAWTKCLRDNGVDIDMPKGDGQGMPGIRMTKENQATTKKAFQACKDKAPKNGPGSEMTQERKDAMVKYAKCMRENGIDMPVPEEGKMAALPMPSTAAEKKAHEKAAKACEDVRP
ncbi:hypothetical protein [Streptomyces malaysiensis]|uniref:hypothetical protein n=1 Tax=Streptomyces malaysiensis TaxID=92644 RepID=UPI00202DCF9B|nr:hypothetical protein [Streptomyces malaysiensis]